jgi:hypothetical protein
MNVYVLQVSQRVRACLSQVGEQVASCPLGQILCRATDRLLWTLETSVQWFVDSRDTNENGSSKQVHLSSTQWRTQEFFRWGVGGGWGWLRNVDGDI